MTQTAINYGKVLYQLNVPKESILETQRLLKEVPELSKALKIQRYPLNKNRELSVEFFQRNFTISCV